MAATTKPRSKRKSPKIRFDKYEGRQPRVRELTEHEEKVLARVRTAWRNDRDHFFESHGASWPDNLNLTDASYQLEALAKLVRFLAMSNERDV